MNTHKIAYIFIGVFVIIVIVGMIVLNLIIPKDTAVQNSMEQNRPTSPVSTPGVQKVTPKLPQVVLSNSEKSKLVALLPYVGTGFVVEYYPLAGTFYVRMSVAGLNTPEYTAALDWLQSAGVVDPQNTTDIQFTFPIIRR